MAIRNAAKAIIVREGKILLNKYCNENGSIYYELPGGGQLQYETMEEAVCRECMEETGFFVKPIRLAAIAEEIYDDIELRNKYPDYVHRIHHIFIAEVVSEEIADTTEIDYHQIESIWIDMNEVQALKLIPRRLKENFIQIINSRNPVYLGSVHEYNLM